MYLIWYYFLSLRPKQWIKNCVIFLPIIFSGNAAQTQYVGRVFLVVLLFCIITWSLYVINDIIDYDKDKLHPSKSRRPIASGKITKNIALWVAICSIFLFIGVFLYIYPLVGKIVLLYIVNTLLYSLYLKKIVILDVVSIAFWFIGRIWIGSAAIGVLPSNWLIMMIFFGALYLWFTKRYQEKSLHTPTRAVLKSYEIDFLKQAITTMLTLLIMTYTLYAFQGIHGQGMLVTVPIVIYGVLRLQLLALSQKYWSQNFEELILHDAGVLISILLYFILVLFIIY